MSGQGPFSGKAALALVAAMGALLLGLAWLAGAAPAQVPAAGAHAGGRGLDGYAGLATLLEVAGYPVAVGSSAGFGASEGSGLLVLTPPAEADGRAIQRRVMAHLPHGPVLVVLPKWQTAAAQGASGAAPGWVWLTGLALPGWKGFADDVAIGVAPAAPPVIGPEGTGAVLPRADLALAGTGAALAPLVTDGAGRVLAAAYRPGWVPPRAPPLILVFEPDLLNNAGLAHAENAALAEALVRRALAGRQGAARAIGFDLALNGLGRPTNLVALAFTPPFLAATLCLLLAGLGVGWRGFVRLAPPERALAAPANGRRLLVANMAALILRARRWRVLGAPYADGAAARLARALGLARSLPPPAQQAALARLLAARGRPDLDLPATLEALAAPHGEGALLQAAQQLHTIERTLTR